MSDLKKWYESLNEGDYEANGIINPHGIGSPNMEEIVTGAPPSSEVVEVEPKIVISVEDTVESKFESTMLSGIKKVKSIERIMFALYTLDEPFESNSVNREMFVKQVQLMASDLNLLAATL